MVYRAFERLPAISWRGFGASEIPRGLAACKTLAAARFLGCPWTRIRARYFVQPIAYITRGSLHHFQPAICIAYMNQKHPGAAVLVKD